MKYIQLASNPDDHQHYTVCVPTVVRPAVTSCSIIDLGTPADKKLKGVLLTDEEYAALPESELNKVEGADFATTDIFDPQAFLDESTAEELKDLLIMDNGGNTVWEYTDTSNEPHVPCTSSIDTADAETHIAFTLATDLAVDLGKLPVKWSATAEEGATISIDDSTGNVIVTHSAPASVHGTLTVSVDMEDFCAANVGMEDYPGRRLKGSRTFDLVIGPIK